jgi:hypothetical protein
VPPATPTPHRSPKGTRTLNDLLLPNPLKDQEEKAEDAKEQPGQSGAPGAGRDESRLDRPRLDQSEGPSRLESLLLLGLLVPGLAQTTWRARPQKPEEED